jgi:hypothetical protein
MNVTIAGTIIYCVHNRQTLRVCLFAGLVRTKCFLFVAYNDKAYFNGFLLMTSNSMDYHRLGLWNSATRKLGANDDNTELPRLN